MQREAYGRAEEQVVAYEAVARRCFLLAHPVRVQMLDILRRTEACVCQLQALLGKPQPYISQQLRLLREAGILVSRRHGPFVFYSLQDAEIRRLLDHLLGPVDPRAPVPWLPTLQQELARCAGKSRGKRFRALRGPKPGR